MEGFQSDAANDPFSVACSVYNAPACSQYIGAQRTGLIEEQMARKNAAMKNVLYSANRVFDADLAMGYSYIRSNDVLAAQTALNTWNSHGKDSLARDADVTRRQFEINEYHYYNKLDTLFFLQVFFIAVLVMIILFYFNRRGFLTTAATGLLTAVLAVIIVIIGISRYFYTIRTRDRRLWHRRYFNKEGPPVDLISAKCPGTDAEAQTKINLNALFNEDQIQCAVDAKQNYKTWLEEANKEAENQMAAASSAASIFEDVGPALPGTCKKK